MEFKVKDFEKIATFNNKRSNRQLVCVTNNLHYIFIKWFQVTKIVIIIFFIFAVENCLIFIK